MTIRKQKKLIESLKEVSIDQRIEITENLFKLQLMKKKDEDVFEIEALFIALNEIPDSPEELDLVDKMAEKE